MFLRLIPRVDLVIIKMIRLCRHVSFFILVLDEDLESKDAKINLSRQINNPRRQLDHEVVMLSVPFVFLPHVLNLGTRFLFSGGELSHP